MRGGFPKNVQRVKGQRKNSMFYPEPQTAQISKGPGSDVNSGNRGKQRFREAAEKISISKQTLKHLSLVKEPHSRPVTERESETELEAVKDN